MTSRVGLPFEKLYVDEMPLGTISMDLAVYVYKQIFNENPKFLASSLYTKNYLNSQVGAHCYTYSYIALILQIRFRQISIYVASPEDMSFNKSRSR